MNNKRILRLISIMLFFVILFADINVLAKIIIEEIEPEDKENIDPNKNSLIKEEIGNFKEVEIKYINVNDYKLIKSKKIKINKNKKDFKLDEEILGYVLVSSNIQKIKGNVVKFYFEKIEDDKNQILANYTIQYVTKDKNNKYVEIIPSDKGEAIIGTKLDIKSKKIDGFKVKDDRKDIVIKNKGNKVVFEYKLIEGLELDKVLNSNVSKVKEENRNRKLKFRAVDKDKNQIKNNDLEKLEINLESTVFEEMLIDNRLIGDIFFKKSGYKYILAYENLQKIKEVPEEGIVIDLEMIEIPDDKNKSVYVVEHIGRSYFKDINLEDNDNKISYIEMPIQTIEVGIGGVGSKVKAFPRDELKFSKFINVDIYAIDIETGKLINVDMGLKDSPYIELNENVLYKIVFNYDLKDEYYKDRENIDITNDNLRKKEDIVKNLNINYLDEEGNKILTREKYSKSVRDTEVIYKAKDIDGYKAKEDEVSLKMDSKDRDENINFLYENLEKFDSEYEIRAIDIDGKPINEYGDFGIKQGFGKDNEKKIVEAPKIEKYNLVSKNIIIKTLDKKDKKIFEFMYENINLSSKNNETIYTERHVKRMNIDGRVIEIDLIDPKVGIGRIDDKVRIDSNKFKGYELIEPIDNNYIEKNLQKDERFNEFKFIYDGKGKIDEDDDKKYASYEVLHLDVDNRDYHVGKKETYNRAIIGAKIAHKALEGDDIETGYSYIEDKKYKMIEVKENKKNKLEFLYEVYKMDYDIEAIDIKTNKVIYKEKRRAKPGGILVNAPKKPLEYEYILVSKTPIFGRLVEGEENKYKFYYEKIDFNKEQTIYTERHVELLETEDGKKIEIDIVEPKIGIDDIGRNLKLSYRDDLKGYEIIDKENKIIERILDENVEKNEFKFVYKKEGSNIDIPDEKEDNKYAAYRVYYLDEEGREIADVKEYKRAIVGSNVEHEAIEIEGYSLVNPNNRFKSIKIRTDKEAGQNNNYNKIIFRYKKSTAKYKINYHLEDSNEKIADSDILGGFDSKPIYASPIKKVEGYSLISKKPKKIVLDKSKVKEVTFYYKKDLEGLVPYTVRHVEEINVDGVTIERDIINPRIGYDEDRIKITASYIDFSNYDLRKDNKKEINVLLNKDRYNEIKFIYINNQENIDDKNELNKLNKNNYTSYTTKYLDEDNNKILEDRKIGRVIAGVEVERSAVYLEDYRVEKSPLKLKILKDRENLIKFKYRYIGRETEGGGGLIIVRPEEEIEEIEEDIQLDIDDDHIAYIQGYPDGTVRPENSVKREEVAAIMYRIMDEEYRESVATIKHEFIDIDKGKWSEEYIATLSSIGVVEGYPNKKYKPNSYATRAELVTMLVRQSGIEVDKSIKTKFSDISDHWANDYIKVAEKEGWIEGYDNERFGPNNNITRAEFVTMINNMLGRWTDKENMIEDRKEFKDLKSYRWYYEAMQEAINSHSCIITSDGKEVWIELLD